MERTVSSMLELWHRFTFTRYLAASVVSLAFDLAIFSSLVALHFAASLSSAIGYCAGIVIHWMVRMLFSRVNRERAMPCNCNGCSSRVQLCSVSRSRSRL
jgi:uncharacterized membrane protein